MGPWVTTRSQSDRAGFVPIPLAHQRKTRHGAHLRRLGPRFWMLYRVYTRSARLNAAKQIHTSPSSYALKLKPVPQRVSRPLVDKEVKEEVVVDEPYGECYISCPKGYLSDELQSNGMNWVSSCSRGMSIPKSSKMPHSRLQKGHTFGSPKATSVPTTLTPAKAPFYRTFPSLFPPYRARTSTNISTDSVPLLPNPG